MKIEASSYTPVDTHQLFVAPELLACAHAFEFENRRVEVRLPQQDEAAGDVRCLSWKEIDGERQPIHFQVYNVGIIVKLSGRISVSDRVLDSPKSGRTLATKAEVDFLDRLTRDQEDLALRVFDYWIRVLRWRSRIWWIGHPASVRGNSPPGGTYLFKQDSPHLFWNGPIRLSGRVINEFVNRETWQAAEASLLSGSEPPPWIEFIADSWHKFTAGDYIGSVLSGAIACEAVLRRLAYLHMGGDSADEEFLAELISGLNVRFIFDRRKRFNLWNKQWEECTNWSHVNKILDLRNKVVHLAANDVDREELRRLLQSGQKLVHFADTNL